MAELDFMILCDHVRPEAGVMHILAAGIDRVSVPRLPVLQSVGIAARFVFEPEEIGHEHPIELEFTGPAGERLSHLRGFVEVTDTRAGADAEWAPLMGGLALNLPVPIQAPGLHNVELSMRGTLLKRISFFVTAGEQG